MGKVSRLRIFRRCRKWLALVSHLSPSRGHTHSWSHRLLVLIRSAKAKASKRRRRLKSRRDQRRPTLGSAEVAPYPKPWRQRKTHFRRQSPLRPLLRLQPERTETKEVARLWQWED